MAPTLPALAPPTHGKPTSQREARRIHTHATQSAKKRRRQKGHVPSAPGRRRKHGRETKALVVKVKPNPKAPLLVWAAHPCPASRAAFVGRCAPGSPRSARQLSTLPCILLRRRGLARAQSSPRTVLGAAAVLSSLEQDPGSPEKHAVMETTATTHEHLLGVLQTLFAVLPSLWPSRGRCPHFVGGMPRMRRFICP